MKRNIWYIDGEEQTFRSLSDVKNHLWALCESDQRKYTDDMIIHDIDGQAVSSVCFHFDEKRKELVYGRTIKAAIII